MIYQITDRPQLCMIRGYFMHALKFYLADRPFFVEENVLYKVILCMH